MRICQNVLAAGKAVLILGLLGAILGASAFIKIRQYREGPLFSFSTDLGLFNSESAFQYRYARMLAEGEPIPVLDRAAQWPEGIRPAYTLALLTEYLTAGSYRIRYGSSSGTPPFHVHIGLFFGLFTCLSVVAVFLGVRALGAGGWQALFAAGMYAFTGASFDRVRWFEHEYVGLPLIFLSFACGLHALRRRPAAVSALVSLASGTLMALALAAWHMVPFFLLCWMGSVAVALLFADRASAQRLVFFGGIWLVPCLVASLGVPFLRETGLAYSPPLVMAYGLGLAGVWMARREADILRKGVVLGAMLLFVAGVCALLGGFSPEHGHVGEMIRAKLLHPWKQPADPSELTFAARSLWYEGFDNVSGSYLAFGFACLLPLGLLGLWRGILQMRPGCAIPTAMVTSIAILFLGVGFLLNRLGVFTAFLLALCVGWVPVSRGGRIPAEAWKAWVGPAGCSAVLLLQVWLAFHYEDNAFRRLVEPRSHSTAAPAVPFWFPSDQEEVIRWIQNHTPTGAVFLSSIELSAMVLKDAGRAVNLQPKFELASARKKFERTVKTLFDTKEPEFARMLADYQTTHILWSAQYALDRGPHSYRYIADRLRLPRESLVYRLHFRPDTFGSLRLVFRNRFFLVYEVVGDLSPRPESPSARNDYPVYNEGVFCGGTERNGESFLDDSAAARVVGQARLAHTRIADAWEAWRGGNARSAAALLRDATHGVLPDGDVYLSAARLALELKQPKGAAEYGEAAVRLNSASAEPRVFLARFYMGAGQPDRALKYANEAMALKTEDIDAFLIAAHVRMARKEFRLAAVILEEARRIDPLNLEVMELSQQVRMAR